MKEQRQDPIQQNTRGEGASGGDSELENIKFIFSAKYQRAQG